jgi:hypothetical protein
MLPFQLHEKPPKKQASPLLPILAQPIKLLGRSGYPLEFSPLQIQQVDAACLVAHDEIAKMRSSKLACSS